MNRCRAGTPAEDRDYRSTAGFFRVLSRKHSLKIASELRYGEMSISAIAVKTGMRPERLFRGILKMVRRRTVHARRQGKRILCSLEHDEIVQVLDLIRIVSERRLMRTSLKGNPLRPRLKPTASRPGTYA